MKNKEKIELFLELDLSPLGGYGSKIGSGFFLFFSYPNGIRNQQNRFRFKIGTVVLKRVRVHYDSDPEPSHLKL